MYSLFWQLYLIFYHLCRIQAAVVVGKRAKGMLACDIVGGRTPDSRSSPSRNNPFRQQASESTGEKAGDPTIPTTTEPSSSAPGNMSRQYDHDRPFSFHKALRGDYGEDLQRLAKDGLLSDYCPADSTDHTMDSEEDVIKENGDVPGRNGPSAPMGLGKFPVASDGTPSPVDESPGRGNSPTEGGGISASADGIKTPEAEGTTSGRLTPSKRSVSLSISNFLKKFSPHLRRKPSTRSTNSSRERGGGKSSKNRSKPGSADGSAQSLSNTASDPETDHEHGRGERGDKPDKGKGSGRFSRSQVRQSFMKLVGRSNSRSKKKNKKASTTDPDGQAIIPTPSHYTIEPHDPDCGVDASSEELDNITSHNGIILTTNNGTSVINTTTRSSSNSNGRVVTSGGVLDPTSVRIMNAIEKNAVAEQDIYRRFKDIHSPKTIDSTLENLSSSGYDNQSPKEHHTTTTYTATIPNISPKVSSTLARPEPLRPAAGHYLPSGDHKTSHSPTHHSLASDGPMDFFTESDISAILQAAKFEHRSKFFEPLSPATQPENISSLEHQTLTHHPPSPPRSLDVDFSTSKPKKLGHLMGVSSMSGDESIGECSLDANLTVSCFHVHAVERRWRRGQQICPDYPRELFYRGFKPRHRRSGLPEGVKACDHPC
ncbi:hypothetical protein PoB_002912300 [Plakobranchus ocellatus]|uniref:Uncharacterized protein n=1 Tax=Plakobranchus ocellatus TaxID=259542 RepID=A0AAV4A5Z6_9GAST|nr:hypothetical protein PoB_002912300 [Plakobranchus ocellatus]